MATLLLELFSEEIPSRMQRGAAEQLQRLILAGFEKNMLKASDVKTFVSPRHLAIQCFGLPTIQPDVKEEKRGPKIGAPEQALKGFLSASGLSLEQCEQRDGYYYATIERKGRAVAEVVKEICESALAAFSWPKSMHWGSRDARPLAWVRPLHRIACLLDDKIVPVTFAHLTASNVTEGHRFLAPAAITITHAEKYEALMTDAKIIVDFAARRAKIAAEIAAVASAAKLGMVADEDLLNEVTGLVEWPVPLLCEFDKKFLDLPPEVLISEMKNHQRYFALTDSAGNLTNQFITVANMVNADGGAKVKEGNARVVRARLADGEFYWEQDRKVSLEDWGKKLSDVVFHAKVGMMDAKVARIEALATDIAIFLFRPKLDALTPVKLAAQLCKADLTSGMVGEFPELQGIMGRYYAKAQGINKDIAEAIYEHYKPQGANDDLPKSDLGAILSVADKLDSIISLFAAGEKPTGSKDPLALRRAALGILRIILQKEWALDLANLGVNGEVSDFFYDRLRNILREDGLRHDAIEAIVTEKGFNPLAIANRTRALAAWLETDIGKTSLAAIKRAMNILTAEEKKSETSFAPSVAGAMEPSEKAIAAALQQAQKNMAAGPDCLEHLAAPIQQFFTNLMVTEEGKREARLSLLAAVREAANHIADFTKIEG
jgi:glycyl-tRNA synthetase beta chain